MYLSISRGYLKFYIPMHLLINTSIHPSIDELLYLAEVVAIVDPHLLEAVLKPSYKALSYTIDSISI